jgi:hypothetical protein
MMPLIVPLTASILAIAVVNMKDSSLAAMARTSAFADLALAPGGYARALIAPGRVLACAGLVPHWPGRAEGWMITAPHATRRDLVAAVRAARAALDVLQTDPIWRRIEIYVRADAAWTDSFTAVLGFQRDACLRAWAPDGADYVLYSRIGAV